MLYGIGVFFAPLGVVLTIQAHLGAGGIDALNFVIAERIGINTSYVIYVMAILMILAAALVRWKMPKFTTVIASVFMGLSTDFWKMIFGHVEGKNLWEQILIFAVGMIIVAIAIASYITSYFPCNPNDDFVKALHERGWRIGVAKLSLDFVATLVAFFLGGEIGVGTVVITLLLGPMIDFINSLLKKVILPRVGVEQTKKEMK